MADASQLTTEELEATLGKGFREAADAAPRARKRDEPAGPLPPRMMAHARMGRRHLEDGCRRCTPCQLMMKKDLCRPCGRRRPPICKI